MKPESMYDEVLTSMSEDEALNARIEAFKAIKNPDRIQKARLGALLMEQKSRQQENAAQTPAADTAQTSALPDLALETKQAAPSANVSPKETIPMDADTVLMPEETPSEAPFIEGIQTNTEIPAIPRTDTGSEAAQAVQTTPSSFSAALQKDSARTENQETGKPEKTQENGTSEEAREEAIAEEAPFEELLFVREEGPEQTESVPKPETVQSAASAKPLAEASITQTTHPESTEAGVPEFFHSDLTYTDLPIDRLNEMANSVTWQDSNEKQVSDLGYPMSFQSPPKPENQSAFQEKAGLLKQAASSFKQKSASASAAIGAMTSQDNPSEMEIPAVTPSEARPAESTGNQPAETPQTFTQKTQNPSAYTQPIQSHADQNSQPSSQQILNVSTQMQSAQPSVSKKEEPTLKHVYVDPNTGKEWHSGMIDTNELEQEMQAGPFASYDENGNPVVYDDGIEVNLPQVYSQPSVREPKSRPWIKTAVALMAVLVIGIAAGFGFWLYKDYNSPDNVAYREFLAAAQNFHANAENLSQDDINTILNMESLYNGFDANRQHEIDSVLKKNTGKDFNGLTAQVKVIQRKNELKAQITQLSSQIDSYTSQIKQTSTSIQEVQDQYDAAQKEADAAKREATQASRKLDNLNNSITRAQETIDQTSAEIAALQQEIAQLEGGANPNDDDDSMTSGALDIFSGFRLSMKKRSLESKQKSLASAQENLQKYQEEKASIQSEAELAQSTYNDKQAAADQFSAALTNMKTSLDTLNSSLSQAQSSLSEMERELASL